MDIGKPLQLRRQLLFQHAVIVIVTAKRPPQKDNKLGACSHCSGQASSSARYEVARCVTRFHRPALEDERKSKMASALARHQNMLGPCKRRVTTRRPGLSMAPLPIGSGMAIRFA